MWKSDWRLKVKKRRKCASSLGWHPSTTTDCSGKLEDDENGRVNLVIISVLKNKTKPKNEPNCSGKIRDILSSASFAGINLEDIKAPECFYVEE